MLRIVLLLIVVLIGGLFFFDLYLKKQAQKFISAAVERKNEWYKKEAGKLFQLHNKTTEQSAATATAHFWQSGTNWTVKTDDQQVLKAKMFQANLASEKWVICVHDYRCDGFTGMADVARMYQKSGYNVLVPDLRGHGESSGEIIGLGWLDRLDMILWINQIVQQAPAAKIILHGDSMGAAAILMASGEKLPENVKLLISDSCFTSVYSESKWVLHQLTKYPINRFMTLANQIAKKRNGFSLLQGSVSRQLGSNHLPVLFLHGAADQIVPVQETKTLMEATAGKKELHIFPQAKHLESRIDDPVGYWQVIFSFIKGNQEFG
ncbi:MAG: alpha/beta hydrolase [Enterococcus sp.]